MTTTSAALRTALDGRWGHLRQHARRELSAGMLLPVPGQDREAHRARVADQMRAWPRPATPAAEHTPAVVG